MMSSVTDIVNMISYVLVAFVAISLIVSSIMIGVITYISVMERRKEIGILRAIGASKRNISEVFNAETFIIGLCAGLLGIILTAVSYTHLDVYKRQTLGAAMVFLMRGTIDPRVEKLLLGFASGVMIAASVWSLLIPSINMTAQAGKIAWVPAVVGFLLDVYKRQHLSIPCLPT